MGDAAPSFLGSQAARGLLACRVTRVDPAEKLCGNCAAFMGARADERFGRVGACALQMITGPVREGMTCSRWRARGALAAPPRARAAGEPRRYAESTTRSARPAGEAPRTTVTSQGAERDLPKEIDIDMDIEEFRRVLREVLQDELGVSRADLAPKWQGGELVLKPGREGTQDKHIPLDVFFKKIVMVRDRLRLLEAKVNAHPGLSEEDKVLLQGYVTGCYGSLTSLNLLFHAREDQFVGAGGKDE